MKVDITSLFVNSYIQGATATAAWATAVGQRKSTGCKIEVAKEGVQDVINGMVYKSVSERSRLDISKVSENREVILVSKFDKVYINGAFHDGLSFILLLCREQTKSHYGRLLVSYPPYVKYDGVQVNKNTMNKIGEALGCTSIGCWFVSEIAIKNQDEIHIKAHVVDKDKCVVYTCSSRQRSLAWQQIVENDK